MAKNMAQSQGGQWGQGQGGYQPGPSGQGFSGGQGGFSGGQGGYIPPPSNQGGYIPQPPNQIPPPQ